MYSIGSMFFCYRVIVFQRPCKFHIRSADRGKGMFVHSSKIGNNFSKRLVQNFNLCELAITGYYWRD